MLSASTWLICWGWLQIGCEYIHAQLERASEDTAINFSMIDIKPII